MHRILTIIALLLLASFAGQDKAAAQTPETQLDTLFAKLRDPATGAAALSIEPQIWSLWMHGGTVAENERLAKATAAMNVAAFPLADKQLTSLITDNPSYAEAWNKRATLYFLMGRFDDSLKDITKTLDLEPRHFGALSGRGMIYQRLGRNAEALTAFKEALSINPTMVGAKLSVQQLEKLVPEL